MRPFEGRAPGRAAALDEIRKLLEDRDRLYARADVTLETSGRSLKATLEDLKSKANT
ncbi:anaerobic benzoate catabolism transcriptional regulator [compost metagenome]